MCFGVSLVFCVYNSHCDDFNMQFIQDNSLPRKLISSWNASMVRGRIKTKRERERGGGKEVERIKLVSLWLKINRKKKLI